MGDVSNFDFDFDNFRVRRDDRSDDEGSRTVVVAVEADEASDREDTGEAESASGSAEISVEGSGSGEAAVAGSLDDSASL